MSRTNLENRGERPAPQQNAAFEEGVKINGMQQVIEMLQNADPAFRESLLRRLTSRDPKLAQQLRRLVR